MFVNAGFIVGFDTEQGNVAMGIIGCVDDTAIPVAMVGLLYALPNTQLTRRLAGEGRLHANFDVQPVGEGDQCTAGLNYDPCRPKVEILRDYLSVVRTIYEPRQYFGRVRRVARALDGTHRHYKASLKRWAKETRGFLRMAKRLGFQRETGREFWRTFLDTLVHNPGAIRYTGALCGLYLHFGPFSR